MTLPDDRGPPQRDLVGFLGDLLLFRPVELGRFEEDDRVVTPERGDEESLGVVGARRDDDREARDLAEEGLRMVKGTMKRPRVLFLMRATCETIWLNAG
jgi:hypothetical protein